MSSLSLSLPPSSPSLSSSPRACLQLIADCPRVIQDELDLVTALSQLEDFGVSILPLQGTARV